VTPETVKALLSHHNLNLLRHMSGPDLYLVQGPVGQEWAIASALEAEPAVEYAEPNYLLSLTAPFESRTPSSAPPPLDSNLPRQLARIEGARPGDSVVIGLHMSSTPGGAAPFQNKFPSTIPSVYAVFTYTVGTSGQLLRVQVTYHDFVTGTAPIFTHTGVYTGTGTASVGVPVGLAFPGQSQFAIGRYETTIYHTPDGGQSWELAFSPVAWQVIIQPKETYYETFQWNLNNTGTQTGGRNTPDGDIDAPEAWAITTGSSDVIIAVLSTGVDLGHPDLQSRLWINPGEVPDNRLDDDGNGYVDDVHGYDFTDDRNPEPMDIWWTGTFMAGIAAAATDNGVGIAGVSWGSRIMAIKAFRLFGCPEKCAPGAYLDWIGEGLTYAVNNGARIILVGFAYGEGDLEVIETLRTLVDYAYNRGVLVVTGAGDLGQASPTLFPAAFEHVVAVAGTEGNDTRTERSSCGPWVDVAAPGANIISTIWDVGRGSYYGFLPTSDSRTIFASAHVAGLAALVWSVNPTLTVDEVRAIIEGTADKVDAIRYPYGPEGRNHCYGHGRINAEQALLATPHVLTLTPSRLVFRVDDTREAPLCRTITNPNTSALTWRVATDAEWLNLEGPRGLTPSYVVACADWRALPERDTYTTVITATSTLTNHDENPVVIPVTLAYTSDHVYLPLIKGRTP